MLSMLAMPSMLQSAGKPSPRQGFRLLSRLGGLGRPSSTCMPSIPNKSQLVAAEDLCRSAAITLNQLNDYVSRGYLKIEKRERRRRLFREPPAAAVLAEIKKFLDEHGNLNRCQKELRAKFPDYYEED